MKIEDMIKQAAQLRDDVQNAIEEIEGAAPHLCNAAGALQTAIRNLEGHLAASQKTEDERQKAED